MSDGPIAGGRGILIARLTAGPTIHTGPDGSRFATLHVATNVHGVKEYVLTVFGRLAVGLDRLSEGQLLYAEGRWQARHDGHPELIVDTMTPLAPYRSQLPDA